MYHCLNLVTEAEGEPAAVLIRGAVPVKNGDIIAKNRFGCKMEDMTAYQRKNFLNGPGKLCRGLDLTRAQNGLDLTRPGGGLYVRSGSPPDPSQVQVGEPRVCAGGTLLYSVCRDDAHLPAHRIHIEGKAVGVGLNRHQAVIAGKPVIL